MKKVIKNKELRNKMNEAIDLLCDTVKTTLGPKSSNVIIDHSDFSPFITNDGVTIARNIESDDPIINTILQLAKEASIKTDDKVGDGTTTTLLLLQSIYYNGLKEIEQGLNPIILKKQLDEYLPKIIKKLKNLSFPSTPNQLTSVASSSANSKEIGRIISEVYQKVQNENAIEIKESTEEKTEIIYKNGYIIDTLIASPYYFKDDLNIKIDNSYILIINNYVNDIENLSNIINEVIITKKPLIIFADDYTDDFINNIISMYLYDDIKIILLKIPEFGKNKIDLLNDISLISNAKINDNQFNISLKNLGNIDNILITKEDTIIKFSKNANIKKLITKLHKLINTNNNMDIEFTQKRIAMFDNGIAQIKVGAATKTERREKKMRFDDALGAITSSQKGLVLGSGITLYEISQNIPENSPASHIIKDSLQEPFKQIMNNAGLEYQQILNTIEKNNYNCVFNITNNRYEEKNTTEVLDTYEVVKNTIINSISIASMLLTTNSIIINEYIDNTKKLNDYNEL